MTSMLSRFPLGWVGDVCEGATGGLGQTDETTGSCAEDTRAGAGGGDTVAGAAAGRLLWTRKSDREAISLSSSKVADVADGFAVAADRDKEPPSAESSDLSLPFSPLGLLLDGNWDIISSVMLNWVALSSCRSRSSSQRPAPSTPLEEEKGGGPPSLGLGERGLQTVL